MRYHVTVSKKGRARPPPKFINADRGFSRPLDPPRFVYYQPIHTPFTL